MKKILAVMALIAIVAFGAFAESTVTVGAGGYGIFENALYSIGPSVKLFTKSGNTFNDLSVESPMWIENIKSFDDIGAFIEDFDFNKSTLPFLQFIRANETFGLALNLLGQDGGIVSLTAGIGGAVLMDGMFLDSNNRLMEFRAGAGAEVYLGLNIAKPLSIVVGVSADYPMFGLRIIKAGGETTTKSYTIEDARIEAAAHIGVGVCF